MKNKYKPVRRIALDDESSSQDWIDAAVTNAHFEARLVTLSDDEVDVVVDNNEVIRRFMPTEFTVGVHLLQRDPNPHGRSVYVVDGLIEHTMDAHCAKCNERALLRRDCAEDDVADDPVFRDEESTFSAPADMAWCAKCDAIAKVAR